MDRMDSLLCKYQSVIIVNIVIKNVFYQIPPTKYLLLNLRVTKRSSEKKKHFGILLPTVVVITQMIVSSDKPNSVMMSLTVHTNDICKETR